MKLQLNKKQDMPLRVAPTDLSGHRFKDYETQLHKNFEEALSVKKTLQ